MSDIFLAQVRCDAFEELALFIAQRLDLGMCHAQAKKALVILNTDSAVGADVLEKLRKLPHVLSIKPIKM